MAGSESSREWAEVEAGGGGNQPGSLYPLRMSNRGRLQAVASPASGHVGTCPPWRLRIFFTIRWNKLSGLVWYYAKL